MGRGLFSTQEKGENAFRQALIKRQLGGCFLMWIPFPGIARAEAQGRHCLRCARRRASCAGITGGFQEQNLLGEGEVGAGVKCNGELTGLWGERGA